MTALLKVPPVEETAILNWATAPEETLCDGVEELTANVAPAGPPAAVPVPVSAAVWGDPAASSATEMEAAKVPAEAGVKVTEKVQLAPSANVAPALASAASMFRIV